MVVMNPARILADVFHTLSKCILIWAIHSNKSAEGVSFITQGLYVLVFGTRYVNIFWTPPKESYWNFSLKIFYILSSLYILLLMLRVYARTREREKAWKMGAISLAASAILAPILTGIFLRKHAEPYDFVWSFSEILESVCVLPQLLLLRQTSTPTVIDSYYLLTLGTYRGLYIVNWIVRVTDPRDIIHRDRAHPISVIFGVIQTALYLDFAYVYWSRQRVKLRGGGIVDSDDISKGWLLRGVLGRRAASIDEEERPALGEDEEDEPRPKPSRWGARGISVSADDGVLPPNGRPRSAARPEDDDLAGILEDDEDDDDAEEVDEGLIPGPSARNNGAIQDVGSGAEWRDGSVK